MQRIKAILIIRSVCYLGRRIDVCIFGRRLQHLPNKQTLPILCLSDITRTYICKTDVYCWNYQTFHLALKKLLYQTYWHESYNN